MVQVFVKEMERAEIVLQEKRASKSLNPFGATIRSFP